MVVERSVAGDAAYRNTLAYDGASLYHLFQWRLDRCPEYRVSCPAPAVTAPDRYEDYLATEPLAFSEPPVPFLTCQPLADSAADTGANQ